MQFFRVNTSRFSTASTAIRFCSTSAQTSSSSNSTSLKPEDLATILNFSGNTFVLSQIDYCAKLAKEANEKHGVPLNVPPQACPDNYDHRVVYCDILAQRSLDPSSFAYPVQFDPPPKHIPGMEVERIVQEPSPALDSKGKPIIPQFVGKKDQADATTTTVTDATAGTAKKVVNAAPSLLGSNFANPFKMQKYGEVHNVSAGEAFDSEAWKKHIEKVPDLTFTFDLPTDDEIDTLLLKVWDPVVLKHRVPSDLAKKNLKFKEAKDYVIGECTKEEVKSSKLKISEAVLRGEIIHSEASSAADSKQGASEFLPHFKTPFTTTATSSSSLQDDSSSGGIDQLSFSPPTLSKYQIRDLYRCEECGEAFRLYEGLENHIRSVHLQQQQQESSSTTKVNMEKLLQYRDLSYQQQNGILPSAAATNNGATATAASLLKAKLDFIKKKKLEEKLKKEQEAAAAVAQQQQIDDAKNAVSEAEQQQANKTESSGTTTTQNSPRAVIGEEAIQATPVPEVDITLHSRTPNNMQLLGLVKKIQTGYAGRHYVAELLVETEIPTSSASENSNNETDGDEKKSSTATYHKDIFTVRCFGEEFANLTANSVTEGMSRVMIQGTYKSNLHIDRTSGKPQHFPFVKVVPPFGSVIVVT